MLSLFENRESVLAAFDVDDGVIVGGGRFDRAAVFAPYYYERAIDGASDQVVSHDGRSVDVFEVTYADRAMFPELAEAEAVALSTDESGAITCESITWADVHAMECADYANPF